MEPASRLRATSRANKKRAIKIETGDALPAVKLATEYVGIRAGGRRKSNVS